jgi:retron-type reverse transcriptase
MSRLEALKSAQTLSDVARLLLFKPSALSYLIIKQPSAGKYTTFAIPKRTGGARTIKAPAARLKLLQASLSDLLQDCLDEIDKARNRKDNIAHGFKRGRSIITNATQHRKRRWVLNLDLQDFFPSINFGRVRGYFIQDRDFQLPAAVATVLAQIACDNNELPQGSPCSPVVSNLIAHVLDMHLVRLASRVGCTYSRYADDLTFSTNKKDFPADIAYPTEDNPHLWVPGTELQRIISHAGFRLNPRKTRMQYRTSRQDVTGLVVNQKINVRHEYRHNVRAMVHALFSTGSFEVYGIVKNNGHVTLEKREGTLNELHGRLGFIDSIDLYNKKHHVDDGKGQGYLPKKEAMYRQFLIYKDFYTAEMPVIICEGDTDNIYLTHAIRSLAAGFPSLAEIDAEGKIRLKVRIYKYPRSSTARILGLRDGGSGNLANFIGTYRRDTENFKAPGLKSPVIILYDNDSGADAIRKRIKEEFKKAVKPTDVYSSIVHGLYAVATPLVGGAQSKIEDFFDAATKATKIGEKSFQDNNKADKEKYYSKRYFAEKVIQVKAGSIDFTGFRPLLKNLTLAIEAHATAVSGTVSEAAEEANA